LKLRRNPAAAVGIAGDLIVAVVALTPVRRRAICREGRPPRLRTIHADQARNGSIAR
jgi:hypothetical protein